MIPSLAREWSIFSRMMPFDGSSFHRFNSACSSSNSANHSVVSSCNLTTGFNSSRIDAILSLIHTGWQALAARIPRCTVYSACGFQYRRGCYVLAGRAEDARLIVALPNEHYVGVERSTTQAAITSLTDDGRTTLG